MRISHCAPSLLAALLISATSGAANDADIDYAENLIRAAYYEGLPYSEAKQVSEAGAAHLSLLLLDPGETATHAQILTVLGMCGHPGSFEAITAYAKTLRSVELDRSRFRAWRSIPGALGYLARKDPRALAWLIEQLGQPPSDHPRFGKHDLAQLHRRAAAYALGTSGQAEAQTVLRGMSNRRSATGRDEDERFARALQEALELHASVAARGANQ